MSTFFRIKVCGITQARDAEAAVRAGADAIGLNFYPGSPRCVPVEVATEIARSLPASVASVGLFVNESWEKIVELSDQLDLDYIQLHGDEPPELAARLAPRAVIRAFRLGESSSPLQSYLAQCQQIHCKLAAVLIDSCKPGEMGGTGVVGNWGEAKKLGRDIYPQPLILAGGLNPDNVGAAIREVRPAAVDVASGVECHPGKKDEERMRRFVTAARAAWESFA